MSADPEDAEYIEPVPVVLAPPSGRAWMEVAACASKGGPGFMYPDGDDVPVELRRLCSACPVQMECLDYALATGERHGVWGGTGERERRAIARNVHGTPERYQARRCRCEHCTAAISRWRHVQREAERIIAAIRASRGLNP